MSKYRYEMGGIIRDTEIDFPYYTDEIIELLDEKDQRIAELEEQLKNAIVPKFKIGQEVWYIVQEKIKSYKIAYIEGINFRYCDKDGSWLGEKDLFATKEEAEQKLKELKGGNK